MGFATIDGTLMRRPNYNGFTNCLSGDATLREDDPGFPRVVKNRDQHARNYGHFRIG